MRPALLLALAAAPLTAQTPSPFRPRDLPPPSAMRSAGGGPGRGYWQNRADYRLEARIDTAQHTLHGSGTIRYTNNSPDTLGFLWLQLDQEIFAPTSINRLAPPPPLVFAGAPFDMAVKESGGLVLERISAQGAPAATYRWDTMLRVDLARALAPGDSAVLELAWRFRIPENGVARMGRDGTLYQIAQWYPRLAVYDDVNGWNTLPYIGPGEFYLEYGDFEVRIVAPGNYLVAASGELRNPEQVLTPAQRQRLARAAAADAPVAVITREEAGTAAARARATGGDGTHTWQFTARNVRDFAFALAPGFQWDAMRYDAGAHGVKMIHTYYRPGAANWDQAIRMAHHAIRSFSEKWLMYPYPQATVVEGPIQGMEYPQIVFVPAADPHSLSWVLMHELGHQWFPMVVGNDERRYPWMDEGFNSFIDLYVVADWWRARDAAHADSVLNGPLTTYPDVLATGRDQPLITPPAEGRDLYWVAYQKPALMLKLLREEVLDSAAFDRAFAEFARRWQFRHPQPADFFRTMENVSGRDLDWFWRGWVYTAARLDQSVDSVGPGDRGTGGPADSVRVVLGNRGDMIMPAEVRLTWSDGTSDTRRIPVEMWNYGPRHAFTVAARGRQLTEVVVDPRAVYPDTDRNNNRWTTR